MWSSHAEAREYTALAHPLTPRCWPECALSAWKKPRCCFHIGDRRICGPVICLSCAVRHVGLKCPFPSQREPTHSYTNAGLNAHSLHETNKVAAPCALAHQHMTKGEKPLLPATAIQAIQRLGRPRQAGSACGMHFMRQVTPRKERMTGTLSLISQLQLLIRTPYMHAARYAMLCRRIALP